MISNYQCILLISLSNPNCVFKLYIDIIDKKCKEVFVNNCCICLFANFNLKGVKIIGLSSFNY